VLEKTLITYSYFGFYSSFKVLANVCCITDKESDHIPCKELLLVRNVEINLNIWISEDNGKDRVRIQHLATTAMAVAGMESSVHVVTVVLLVLVGLGEVERLRCIRCKAAQFCEWIILM
jgi:hypothetical protein